MASDALVLLRNTGDEPLTFEVDIGKMVKFVNRFVLPPGRSSEIEITNIIPLVLFDRGFQNAIVAGTLILTFDFTTSEGVDSTASNFVWNISKFLNADPNGWLES